MLWVIRPPSTQASLPSPSTTWRWPITLATFIHGAANDSKQFGAGVYLKNSPALETGITLATGGSGGNSFAIGAKYALASDACIRAKVNNTSQIGLSYEQKLRDGIKMTLSTNLDGTKLNEPGHKLGLALEMEA